MREIRDNIWNYLGKGFIVITTNGFVKANGECVMGRGIAREAAERFPRLPKLLGGRLQEEGNHVFDWLFDEIGYGGLITFPVKVNWWEPAKQYLIQKSCQELLNLMKDYGESMKVYIPHAGCKNGKLDWLTQVKPIFEQEFSDEPRIVIVDKFSS